MKRLLSVTCFALLSASCTPSDSPIRILGAHSLKTGPGPCAVEGTIQQLSGSLDISAAQSYGIQFDVLSDLQPIVTSSSGTILATEDRNTFFGKGLILSYTSIPAKTFDPEEQIPIHMAIPPGAGTAPSFVIIDLLTTKAAQRLYDSVVPGENIQVSAKFTIVGELASGGAIRSNTVTFPIKVFSSGFKGCTPLTAGDGGITVPNPRALNGPCGLPGGQDGTQPGCCLLSDGDGGTTVNPSFSASCTTGA